MEKTNIFSYGLLLGKVHVSYMQLSLRNFEIPFSLCVTKLLSIILIPVLSWLKFNS